MIIKTDYEKLMKNALDLKMGVGILEGAIRSMATEKLKFIHEYKYQDEYGYEELLNDHVDISGTLPFGKASGLVQQFPVVVSIVVLTGLSNGIAPIVLTESEVIGADMEENKKLWEKQLQVK